MAIPLQLSRRAPRAVLACASALLLAVAGCASIAPQSHGLLQQSPAGLPAQVQLADVPFFAQSDFQSAPAALASALIHSGAGVQPEALAEQMVPGRRGNLHLEMMAAPRRHGRVSYRLSPTLADVLREVAAGRPVVVLQDVGALGTHWQYGVVDGYDLAQRSLHLRSGVEGRQLVEVGSPGTELEFAL